MWCGSSTATSRSDRFTVKGSGYPCVAGSGAAEKRGEAQAKPERTSSPNPFHGSTGLPQATLVTRFYLYVAQRSIRLSTLIRIVPKNTGNKYELTQKAIDYLNLFCSDNVYKVDENDLKLKD